MHGQTEFVQDIRSLPVSDQKRIRTDFFCIVCNTIFVVLLFIITLALYKNSTMIKISLPNDDQGNICGYGQSNDYTILYYPDINDAKTRVCVNSCPITSDKQVGCFQTNDTKCASLLPISTDTEFQRNRLGLFCFPKDTQQKSILLNNIGLTQRYQFMGTYDAMWRSFYISAIFSTIFVALVQFFPLKVVPWTFLVGCVLSIIVGLVVMIMTSGNFLLRIFVFILAIGLSVACGIILTDDKKMKQIFVCAKLIKISTQVLKENSLTIAYVPIFLVLLFIMLVLVGFQTLGAWSYSTFVFNENYPYYSLKGFGSGFLQFLIAIQFVWGMMFLKQAFNFCVSGVSTRWYFQGNNHSKIDIFKSLYNLVRFHWGSVLGCSLLTAFFYWLDYIVDFIFNTDTEVDAMQAVTYSSLQRKKTYGQQRNAINFLNLCRSQSMSYINLVSTPYCNAARYCEQFSASSDFYDYSQLINRTYRLAAHFLIISIVTFISILSVKSYAGQSSITGILYVALVSLFTVTFFISLHGDMAEGLLISTFVEEGFNSQNKGTKSIQIPRQEVIDLYDEDTDGKFKKPWMNLTHLLLHFEG